MEVETNNEDWRGDMPELLSSKDLVRTIQDRFEFLRDAVLRVIELYVENEGLKQENERLQVELRSRRRQGDIWRKKYHSLKKGKRHA